MVGGIILAAGKGERYEGFKQFEKIQGGKVFEHTIESLGPFCDDMVMAIPKGFTIGGGPDYRCVVGGETRWDSALMAFRELDPKCKYVLVADAVRCNTSRDLIGRLLKQVKKFDCSFPVLPATETAVRYVGGEFAGIHNKLEMCCCQTPEAYKYDSLEKILNDDRTRPFSFLFAYGLMMKGGSVEPIPGDVTNIKVTWPHDLAVMTMLKIARETEKKDKKKT